MGLVFTNPWYFLSMGFSAGLRDVLSDLQGQALTQAPRAPNWRGCSCRRKFLPWATVLVLLMLPLGGAPWGAADFCPQCGLGPRNKQEPREYRGYPTWSLAYYWGPLWPGPELCPRLKMMHVIILVILAVPWAVADPGHHP